MGKLKSGIRERCPICNRWDDVGKQGNGKYFCSECCVEFHYKKKNEIHVFSISANGSLTLLEIIKK